MTEIKALIAHSYIGTLIQACKNEDVKVIASLEDDAFGTFTTLSAQIQHHNWPDVKVLPEVTQWPIVEALPRDNHWFLIANPPCAGGSMVTPTHARGGLDNPKSAFHVTKKFMRYAYAVHAPIIAVESVPGTLNYCGGDLKTIRDEYGPGYGIVFALEESRRYGCISIRKRLWHFHYRKDLFPDGLELNQEAPRSRTLREALEGAENAPDHVVSKTQQNLYNRCAALFNALPQGMYANNFLRKSGRWDLVPADLPIKTKSNGELYLFYESTANKKLDWDSPAPTITGSTFLLHPQLPRPLTSREMLRINGLPDTFSFPPSMNSGKHVTYIGKTITPGIGQWVVRQIIANLKTLA